MNKIFNKILSFTSKPLYSDFRKTLTLKRPLFPTVKNDPSKFLKNLFKISASTLLFSSMLYHHQTQCEAKEEHKPEEEHHQKYPVEMASMAYAPNVPPPITRTYPALVKVKFEFSTLRRNVTRRTKYDFWAINGSVPAPFIRCRVGDVLEVTVVNNDESGMPHNIDLHCVLGPGGGAPVTTVQQEQTKIAKFKLTTPGLFLYHCANAPIPLHIANGMYGLILVEPEKGLPKVDKEFYVMQSEFYFNPPTPGEEAATMAYDKGLLEEPDAVVFNGREGSLTDKNPLTAKTGETIRIYFGNAGPNLTSNLHIIGSIFDKVYREGDIISPPARNIQTTLVPAGGVAIVEFQSLVPGNYALIDHAIFRLDKGAVGFINLTGPKRPDLYTSAEEPEPCFNCKVHP